MEAVLEKYAGVKTYLQHYKGLATDVLLAYVPKKEPFKYLYDLVSRYPKREGKGFRPGLCISTCKAFGGTEDMALRSSAALEFFHNAFLVHDDVEDDSEFRRGSPTMNREFGVPIAVNVGDAMNVLSLRPLMENIYSLGPTLTWQIMTEIEHMVRQSVEGQAMELGWVHDNVCEIVEDDYLRMTLKKTCWYTCIHPCRIGALIGTKGEIDIERFNRFGYYMGAAFQIQDDVLNIVADYQKYGKEIGGDIREGKRTLMLIHTLNACKSSEREELKVYLAKPWKKRTAREVRQVFDMMVKYDAIEHARSSSRQLAGAALREFFVAYKGIPDSLDRSFIQNIIMYMIERDL